MNQFLSLLEKNNLKELENFIRNHVYIKELGITPLMIASYYGNLEYVKLLLKYYKINDTDINNLSALMYSCLESPKLTLKRFHIFTSNNNLSKQELTNDRALDRFKIAEYLLNNNCVTTYLSKEIKTFDICDTLNKATPLDIYMSNSYLDNLEFIDLLLAYKIGFNYDPDYFYKEALLNTNTLNHIPSKRILRKKAKHLEKLI